MLHGWPKKIDLFPESDFIDPVRGRSADTAAGAGKGTGCPEATGEYAAVIIQGKEALQWFRNIIS